MEEAELVELAVKGDLDAFNDLVLIYQNLAYNAAYRIMGDPDAASDATQEAVIAMYRKLDTYRGGSFKSWFLRIVTNACYDELRRHKRRPTVPLEPETADGDVIDTPAWEVDNAPSVEEKLSASEVELAIQHCLNDLDPKFRIVMVLVDISGQDYESVAAAIGSPMGTVKSRLARARQKMQGCLEGFGELLPEKFRLILEEKDDKE